MSKILAFAASNSTQSINKVFAQHAANLISNEFTLLDLNDYECPLYSTDKESSLGIPESIKIFNSKIKSSDVIIISFAEHNGSYSAAFKNMFDWSSRENPKIFENKKLVLLSTSPGPRGASTVLQAAAQRLPFHGAQILGQFSLPSFSKNFKSDVGIIDNELKKSFDQFIINIKELMD